MNGCTVNKRLKGRSDLINSRQPLSGELKIDFILCLGLDDLALLGQFRRISVISG